MKIRRKRIKNIEWHWHKCVPFVVAEAVNPEWEAIKKINPPLTLLAEMYNEDGGWFILESPLYWWFGIDFDEFCLYDSLHLEHSRMTKEQRRQSMIDKAHEDIDNLFNIKKLWER